jgi:hypothetical protein
MQAQSAFTHDALLAHGGERLRKEGFGFTLVGSVPMVLVCAPNASALLSAQAAS